MGEKTVRDWMHRGVISCRPDTSVKEVAQTMDSKDVSALVVVNEAGEAVGVISRTDLVNARFVQPYLKHWRGMTAEHLMSRPVISVTPDTPISEAVRMLRERRIHRLVVVEQEDNQVRPLGILSVTDLARHVTEGKA
ncbi:MAG: CBS domain-containing protein [Acidobacteria bacterium]|nr:CBS domain-containing protein [Acidobacteriota bacterium]